MIRASCIALLLAGFIVPAHADTRPTIKDGVALTVFRGGDRAVLCLSTRSPVQLSGEYGIHASWIGRGQGKPVELYSKDEHFALPVRLELPLPRDARAVRVEVGACIDNDSCDMVEISYDLRRLAPSAGPAASCAR